MELVSTPPALECSNCGTSIEEAGYVPATEVAGGYEVKPDSAVCDGCGFNEIGMMGCAPTVDEVVESGSDDVLLYVNSTDAGFQVISAKG